VAGTQTEEVRLAMGWNGGVSLAVWMGGVAVELDCARRAHISTEEDTVPPRRIYHALCDAFDRRLVLDIFAGASAGGLNSAFLGAAIHRGRRLHPDFMREKWLKIGDFGGLLQPTNKPTPTSVMQGEVFEEALLAAFTDLMTPRANATLEDPDLCALPPAQASLPSSRPLLDIQTTNVVGRQYGFRDAWNRELVAREYRAPFRFRKDAQFTPFNLAAAARASASFPAAFEPFTIKETALEVAGLSVDVRPEAAGQPARQTQVQARHAIDGGLLENAPIRQAIELIPSRPASGPVKRFVCYVNANPSSRAADATDPDPPALRDVLAYVVNLPRVGRDIDQLDAITDAARRGAANAETVKALVGVSQESLVATARALFNSYRQRRAVAAIEEILAAPLRPASFELAERVLQATDNGALLPWLPVSLDTPASGAAWRWGFRAAQRVLYLQLDVLAGALRAAVETDAFDNVAQTVYGARAPIDSAIAAIDRAHEAFLEEPGLAVRVAGLPTSVDVNDKREALAVLETIFSNYRDDNVYQPVKTATETFYTAAKTLAEAGTFPFSLEQLFGIAGERAPDALTEPAFDHFLERALAIEVVRRAFVDDADIDAAQTLRFIQLAPNAAVRIFTAAPVSKTGPADGEAKLTGIRLGHFAGFYRRSWRANDFMWGRLDAIARIVDLLVDPHWNIRLPATAAPWSRLAEALVADGPEVEASDQRKLVHEALLDAQTEAADLRPEVATYLAGEPIPGPDEVAALRECVSHALEIDLGPGPDSTCGFLTRVLCARAAQYEVLRQELPVLVQETRGDLDLGCFTQPFRWETEGSLISCLEDLRKYEGDDALPVRLGRDSGDESASALALRTVAHTVLVALAALPGISMPLSRITTPGRLPFLSIAGLAARSLLANLAVVLSFGAASFYLTARIITSDNHGKHDVLLGELVSPPVLTMAVAGLVVIGVLLVPVWRAVRTSKRLRNAFWSVLLLLSGGAIAVGAGIATIGTAQTLTGSGGFNPGRWVLAAVFIAAGLGVTGARHLKTLQAVVEKFRQARTWATSLISIVAASIVLVWSAPHVVHALNDGGWHPIAAVPALLSMPLLVAYAFASGWGKTALSALGWLKGRLTT
jgi:predicted acylesterase/phospholipase RssA